MAFNSSNSGSVRDWMNAWVCGEGAMAAILGLDARTIGTDADAHRVIDYALDGNEDFHRFLRCCRVFGKYGGEGQVRGGKF